MDKRAFIKKASLVTVLASFGLTLESCSSDDEPTPGNTSKTTIDLNNSSFSSLKSPGGWVLHPTQKILLVNVGGTISAFSSVCTHEGCSTDWSFSGEFLCGCHGSRFDTSGNVTNGPASRPLSRISVTRDGDTLTLG